MATKAYYQAHKAEAAAYQRQYAASHKEKIRARDKIYRERYKARIVAYRQANKEAAIYYRRKMKYGLSAEEQKQLFSSPCAICGGRAQVIDHDHSSGKVRSVLCRNCNTGIGMFKDNPLLLKEAISYLEFYR